MFKTTHKNLIDINTLVPTLSDYLTLKFCFDEWKNNHSNVNNAVVIDYLFENATTIEKLFVYLYGLVIYWKDADLINEYTEQLAKLISKDKIKSITGDLKSTAELTKEYDKFDRFG